MCKAIPIKKNIPEKYILREAPEGQVRTTDAVCKKCIYSAQIGAGERYIACMYADKENKCRSLEPDYVHGYCKYFKKGKRKVGDQFKRTFFKAELDARHLKER